MLTLTVELLNPKARTILDGLEKVGLITIGDPTNRQKIHSITSVQVTKIKNVLMY